MVKNVDDMFIRFDTTHERARQTDRQTRRHRMTALAALMHSIAWQEGTRMVTGRPGAMSDTRIMQHVDPPWGRVIYNTTTVSAGKLSVADEHVIFIQTELLLLLLAAARRRI